jgi:hypothetical protein
MTRTPKQTASAIEKSITEILGYKKKITDKLITEICERNNINEHHIRIIGVLNKEENEFSATKN